MVYTNIRRHLVIYPMMREGDKGKFRRLYTYAKKIRRKEVTNKEPWSFYIINKVYYDKAIIFKNVI